MTKTKKKVNKQSEDQIMKRIKQKRKVWGKRDLHLNKIPYC